MSRVIYIEHADDEHVHVYGENLDLTANHDEHGSAGMALLESEVRAMAEAFGAEVVAVPYCGCCADGDTDAVDLDAEDTSCGFCGHTPDAHGEAES